MARRLTTDLRRGVPKWRRSLARPGIALAAMVTALVVIAVATGHDGASNNSRQGPPVTSPRGRGSGTVAPSRSSTTTTAVPGVAKGVTTLTDSGPGALPQTGAFPSASSPGFAMEMAALWRGITTDSLAAALPAFFPEAAYLQLKTVTAPRVDYLDRLLVELQLDIHAAHALLGSDGASAALVRVDVPSFQAIWVKPGTCYNSLGYFEVGGSRLVYREAGQLRSIGIASLISWRGVWYVVHLGAISRASEIGVVDSPAPGAGAPGPAGVC